MEMILYSESNKSIYVVNENSNKDSTMDVTRRSGQDGKGKTKFQHVSTVSVIVYRSSFKPFFNDLC